MSLESIKARDIDVHTKSKYKYFQVHKIKDIMNEITGFDARVQKYIFLGKHEFRVDKGARHLCTHKK